jgi:hypothetical protein
MTAEQFLDAIRSIMGVWPEPDARAFRGDGRGQGGQLVAVLNAIDPISASAVERQQQENSQRKAGSGSPADSAARTLWGARRLPAALTPLDALQASLGRPNREQIVSTRPAEFTTLEAITLSNGPELSDELDRGAARLMSEYQGTVDGLIDRLFFAALVRAPSDSEREVAREWLGSEPTVEGLVDVLWSLFLLPEFQIIR